MKIIDAWREILDSRGNPTVEVEVMLDGGARAGGRAVGRIDRRARSARTARRRQGRYLGKGVRKAVANVNGEIADALDGSELTSARWTRR